MVADKLKGERQMSFGTTEEPVRKLQRLAGTMGLVGIGMLILAVMVSVLAFTGYDTPQAVNTTLLYIGVILAVLGSLCLSAGKSFVRAANDPAALLGPALESTNRLFLFCLIMLSLAVLIVGSETARFLEKVVSR